MDAQGTGTVTGLRYTIPAGTTGKVHAQLTVSAVSSEDLRMINSLILSFLPSSQRAQLEQRMASSASRDVTFFSMFGGSGASASAEETRDNMRSFGLSDAQIDTVLQLLSDAASRMSQVSLDLEIDNTSNDHDVEGDLELYTVSGQVTTAYGSREYRLLANEGTADGQAALSRLAPGDACQPQTEQDLSYAACYSWCPNNLENNCWRCKCRSCAVCYEAETPLIQLQ